MSEDQKTRVVEVASRMFTESGIKSIRMDDIATQMGISKRTIYELFKDKEDLLYQSIRYMFDSEHVDAASRISLDEGYLPSVFDGFTAMAEHANVRRRMMNNLQKFYPQLFERITRENAKIGIAHLRMVISKCIETGVIKPDIDVEMSALMIYYAAAGIFAFQNKIALPDGINEEDALFYMIVYFFRGMATIKGVEQVDAYIADRKLFRYK